MSNVRIFTQDTVSYTWTDFGICSSPQDLSAGKGSQAGSGEHLDKSRRARKECESGITSSMDKVSRRSSDDW
jgi:hypothetical protein